MAIRIVPTKEGMKDIDRSTFKDVDAMAQREGDIEQTVVGADGRTYGVGSTEILTEEQKADIGRTIGGNVGEENIPASENMGLDSLMPEMSAESKVIFDALVAQGIEPSTAIEIMARDTVDSMEKIGVAGGVRPEEFGGLPKVPPLTGSSPDAMATAGGAGMSQGDMASYLAQRVNDIRRRTGAAVPYSELEQLIRTRAGAAVPPAEVEMLQKMQRPTGMQQFDNRRGALPTGMMGAT
jgi:hypothetical protein